AGGLNLYAYAPNPYGWVDPLGLAKCALSSKMVKEVNGRLPINSKFAGKIYPLENLPVGIRNKYPHSVPFNHAGFPDFTRYSINNVRIELGRTRGIDFARADKAVGYGRGNPRPAEYTWHHHQNSGYMQLIPTDIHAAIKHTGGIATGR
ncbi:HNH endonuclease, partial [Erwinia amylovora]